MYVKSWDLLVILVICVTAIVLAFGGVVNPITGVIFGLPLLLFLPGYAITTALADPSLGWVESLIISSGLSIVLTAVGGLLLNLTPWGLQPGSWTLYLGSISLGFSVIAQLRREQRSAFMLPGFSNFKFKWLQSLFLLLAVALTIGAITIARTGADYQVSNFTQLWLLPTVQSSQNTVEVGITNLEAQTIQYKLELQVDNKPVQQWASIEIEAGKQWVIEATLPNSGTKNVRAVLYLANQPNTVYRQVYLTRP